MARMSSHLPLGDTKGERRLGVVKRLSPSLSEAASASCWDVTGPAPAKTGHWVTLKL